ncbi:MAG: multidrug effflux MFS transporter [Alphaproteobacteria bacterium]|nr:multidrug effflux MFS transporter [Alphaproteobacteria bacterium]
MERKAKYTEGVETVEKSTYKQKWTLFALTISIIAAYIETDIYVPSFPDMLIYFSTDETTLQLIVSGNFLGIFIGSLIYGPLADAFGRRKILLTGILLFIISSIGCFMSQSIYQLIFWRLIQGFGSAVGMCVPLAVIFDMYPPTKAAKVLALVSSVITATMAFAPVTGSWLNILYGWQANFILITVIASVSFIALYILLDETLKVESRHQLNLKQICKNYYTISTDRTFFLNTAILSLMYSAFIIYLSNLSLIFINHLHIDEKIYAWYQSTTMGLYALFCLLFATIVSFIGVEKTKNYGSALCLIGTAMLLLTAFYMSTSPVAITVTFGVVVIGCATSINIYAMKALEVFPKMNGMATSMCISLRQLICSTVVFASSFFFDGSIAPVAIATLILAILCIIAYFKLPKSTE